MPVTALAAPSTATLLPVHPRRSGWRAGAAAALVAFAVSELRAGRCPHRDVLALAELGGGDGPRGAAAAEELDRRLAAAVAGVTDDLQLHRARAAAFDSRTAPAPLLDEEPADLVAGTLFDGLGVTAVAGCPHPGEWVASSVDVVPCAVHGYEAGPVDCLRRSVRRHLGEVVDRVAGVRSSTGARALADQVRAATADRADRVDRAGRADDADQEGPGHDGVLRALWVGVATLAAWQSHAATL